MTRLLRVLHLASPTLPIGAFAYSQGLEQAVERGWVTGEEDTREWVVGLLESSVSRLDLPVLLQAYEALEASDSDRALFLCRRLLAARESREMQVEEQHLGRAMALVLQSLGVVAAKPWAEEDDATLVVLFALGAVHYGIAATDAAAAYAFAWADHQISAATRLVPLGQRVAQRVLSAVLDVVPAAVARAASLDNDEIGASTPAQAMASAWHERQTVRLFRS